MATLTQRVAELTDQLAALTKQIERLMKYNDTYAAAEGIGRILGRDEVLEELARQPLVVRREAQQHRERTRASLWSQERPRPNHLHSV